MIRAEDIVHLRLRDVIEIGKEKVESRGVPDGRKVSWLKGSIDLIVAKLRITEE